VIDGQAEKQKQNHRQAEAAEPAVDAVASAGQLVETEQRHERDDPQSRHLDLRGVGSRQGGKVTSQVALTGESRPEARGPVRAAQQETEAGVGRREVEKAEAGGEESDAPPQQATHRAPRRVGDRERQQGHERHQETAGWAQAAPPHAPRQDRQEDGRAHQHMRPRRPGRAPREAHEPRQSDEEHRGMR